MKESIFSVPVENLVESKHYDFFIKENRSFQVSQISTYELVTVCRNHSFFMRKIQELKKEYIYPSEMHGITHNERVAILSYYMALRLGLSLEEQELVIDAAFYHDTGRINDIDDVLHGDRSADNIDKIITDYDSNYIKQLKVVITCHSHEDEEMDDLIKSSGVDFETTKQMDCILKDADGLDRVRFDGLNPKYLRLEVSKHLLNASAGLFDSYEVLKKKDGYKLQKTVF